MGCYWVRGKIWILRKGLVWDCSAIWRDARLLLSVSNGSQFHWVAEPWNQTRRSSGLRPSPSVLVEPDDKKKILLEHSGELKYEPVVKSFRLLGSKFFSELQGGRSTGKTKVSMWPNWPIPNVFALPRKCQRKELLLQWWMTRNQNLMPSSWK